MTTPRRDIERTDQKLLEMQAELCRALGHPLRLHVISLLACGERSSGELLRALGVSKVNLSQHLALMKHVGLIESRQEGRRAFHRLAIAEIKDACQIIRNVLAARLHQTTRLAADLGRRDPGESR